MSPSRSPAPSPPSALTVRCSPRCSGTAFRVLVRSRPETVAGTRRSAFRESPRPPPPGSLWSVSEAWSSRLRQWGCASTGRETSLHVAGKFRIEGAFADHGTPPLGAGPSGTLCSFFHSELVQRPTSRSRRVQETTVHLKIHDGVPKINSPKTPRQPVWLILRGCRGISLGMDFSPGAAYFSLAWFSRGTGESGEAGEIPGCSADSVRKSKTVSVPLSMSACAVWSRAGPRFLHSPQDGDAK